MALDNLIQKREKQSSFNQVRIHLGMQSVGNGIAIRSKLEYEEVVVCLNPAQFYVDDSVTYCNSVKRNGYDL